MSDDTLDLLKVALRDEDMAGWRTAIQRLSGHALNTAHVDLIRETIARGDAFARRRSATILLNASLDPDLAAQLLANLIDDESWTVREAAILAMSPWIHEWSERHVSDFREKLFQRSLFDRNEHVRLAANGILTQVATEEDALPRLKELYDEARPAVRCRILEASRSLCSSTDLELLLAAAEDSSEKVRRKAVTLLTDHDAAPQRILPVLAKRSLAETSNNDAALACRRQVSRLPDSERRLVSSLFESPSAEVALQLLMDSDDVVRDDRIASLLQRRLRWHKTTRNVTIDPETECVPQLLAISAKPQGEAAWLIARILELRWSQ